MKTTFLTFVTLFSFVGFAVAHSHDGVPCQGHHHDAEVPHVEPKEHLHEPHDHAIEAEAHDHAVHAHIHDAHDHDENAACAAGDGHNHAAEEQAVIVPEAMQKLIGLTTQWAEKRQLFSAVKLRGRFEIDPDAQAVAVAPIAGKITLKRNTFDSFAAGDVLATITSPELRMRANELQTLKQRLENYQAAKIANAELAMQLKIKQGEWDALVGMEEVVDGVLTVKAPLAGSIGQCLIPDGTWVEMGAPIYQLLPASPLRFKAFLPPNEAKQLTNGMHVHYGKNVGQLRLGFASESGLTPIYVYFKDVIAEKLDGAYAEMECRLASDEKPLMAVPKCALLRMGVQSTVFIRDAHHRERFIACAVTPGVEHQGWIAVTGLPCEGAEVVTAGQYELKLALPSAAPKPAGHYHADGSFHTGEH